MEAKTHEILTLLQAALSEDPRSVALETAEEALENSEEVRALSNKAKLAYEEFGYAQDHFGLESPITKERQHDLYLAKKALDEHPLSRDYAKKYALVRSLYAEIDALLIGPYRDKRVCLERKK